jgi:hypothetical protein
MTIATNGDGGRNAEDGDGCVASHASVVAHLSTPGLLFDGLLRLASAGHSGWLPFAP